MRPSRDYSPTGLVRKDEKRSIWRGRRWDRRLNGLRRALMRELGYETTLPAPVYPQLARRAWR